MCDISFEAEFGNPRFETPQKLNVFNFQLTCFSAIVDFIIWFCLSSAEKLGALNLFFSHFFFMLSSKRGVSNPAFQNLGSNPTWFWKPEKNPFQTWKRPFLVYFKRATKVNRKSNLTPLWKWKLATHFNRFTFVDIKYLSQSKQSAFLTMWKFSSGRLHFW